jgi:hypothetical protein
MATYNWSLKPNIPNRYNLDIEDTPDDIKPSNAVYVALWGNDITGNGSRMYPVRTFEVARFMAATLIVGSGTYREIARIGGQGYADGDVFVDNMINGEAATLRLFGFRLDLKDNLDLYNSAFSIVNCNGVVKINSSDSLKYCIINSKTRIEVDSSLTLSVSESGNNTFINSKVYPNGGNSSTPISYVSCFYFSIFDGCDFTFQKYGSTVLPPIWDYCLFHNCRFRMLETDSYISIDNNEDLIAFIKTVHPDYIGLQNVTFADPKFNEPSVGNYSLAFDSPAKNRSYFGTFVGAQSIGYSIKARATEADGDFDFSTNVNLNVLDNSITFVDDSAIGSIETIVKPNLIGREFGRAPIYGFNADRNGQYIDSITDLSETTVSSSELLTENTPYIVEIASITYGVNVIQAGQRFTTTDVQTFATEGGVCREIIEAPQRHTVMARFFNGGATKVVGDALTVNYWYYVTGTVTYNSTVYTDQVFKAIDASSFTGSGIVIEAMTDQVYQHYEPGIKFTSNNVGDVRTGEIIRGNGDPAYVRGNGKEFPISAKFLQIKYILQPNNLKP